MTFNVEKLAAISKPCNEEAKKKARQRKENREWLRMSQHIVLSVHYYMRIDGMTQKELAKKMGVSPVYISKLLKGSENLTLETISKLQKALGKELVSIARPYTISQVPIVDISYKLSVNTVNSDTYSKMEQSHCAAAIDIMA